MNEGNRPKVAERLRRVRLIDRAGISQTTAAMEIGVCLSTFHKAERYAVIPDSLLPRILSWINLNKRNRQRKEPAATV